MYLVEWPDTSRAKKCPTLAIDRSPWSLSSSVFGPGQDKVSQYIEDTQGSFLMHGKEFKVVVGKEFKVVVGKELML